MNGERKQKLKVGQEKLFNLIAWKLYWEEQMVSQKSMLPRAARSDFLGKKNVFLPYCTYYFQQRRSLYSAQDNLWLGIVTKLGLNGSPPHVPKFRLGLPNLSSRSKSPIWKPATNGSQHYTPVGYSPHSWSWQIRAWFPTPWWTVWSSHGFRAPDSEGPGQQQETQAIWSQKTKAQAVACTTTLRRSPPIYTTG